MKVLQPNVTPSLGTARPKVTVVIPTYNRWPYICDAIDSVFAQRYPNIACVVVDDKSSDRTPERLIDRYREDESSPAILVQERNAGQSAARNAGVRYADSTFICFLDSDDVLSEPDSIKDRVEIFQENPNFYGLVFGYYIPDNECFPSPKIKKKRGDSLTLDEYLATKEILCVDNVLIPRQLFLRHDGFNRALHNFEDVDLFTRLMCEVDAVCCGTITAKVRAITDHRARNNYKRIVEQSRLFFDALSGDELIRSALGKTRLQELLRYIKNDELKALYRGKSYHEYRGRVAYYAKNNEIRVEPKTVKRYLLSFLKQWAEDLLFYRRRINGS